MINTRRIDRNDCTWSFPELKLDQRDGRYATESGSQQAKGVVLQIHEFTAQYINPCSPPHDTGFFALRLRHFLRRAKLTGLNDFNVAIAELSQTETVVSSLVLGYMFLGGKIERMVRAK